MKIILSLFILLFTKLPGQGKVESFHIKKTVVDSIDYSNFKFEDCYVLKKLKQVKGYETTDYNDSQLFFFQVTPTSVENSDFYSKLLNYKDKDTIIPMEWDQPDEVLSRPYYRHSYGILRFNRKTNTIFVKSAHHNAKLNRPEIVERKFKVIKWTFSELILKDISNLDFDRTFYFRRSRCK